MQLGIPSIILTDGPHGPRKHTGDGDQVTLEESVPAICLPTASALLATWNLSLIYWFRKALAEVCREEKVAVILSPGVNIKRSLLCSSNIEYFSENFFLSGKIAKSHIRDIQS